MRCEFLGTGTSHGIPVIACACHCCRSTDSRDKRFRSSLWITEGDSLAPSTSILIDMGPDFRSQALKSSINRLDALLVTHGHADHLNGLDDIRVFSHTGSREPPQSDGEGRVYPETEGDGLPVYGNEETLSDLRRRFSYIFLPTGEGGGRPKVKTVDCGAYGEMNPLVIGGLSVIPVPLHHGRMETVGWMVLRDYHPAGQADGGGGLDRCRGIAYLTDCNGVPPASMELLRRFGPRLEHVVIDGLRPQPHTTHFSYDQSLELALEIGGRHSWLTHLCHDMTHVQIQGYLTERLALLSGDRTHPHSQKAGSFHCQPAHDGLVLEV